MDPVAKDDVGQTIQSPIGGFVFAWTATPKLQAMNADDYLFVVGCCILPIAALSLLGRLISVFEPKA